MAKRNVHSLLYEPKYTHIKDSRPQALCSKVYGPQQEVEWRERAVAGFMSPNVSEYVGINGHIEVSSNEQAS